MQAGRLSHPIREAFEAGALDAAIIRREAGGDDDVLGTDQLGWRAAGGLRLAAGAPVPLALLAPRCGVGAAATRALEAAGLPWREVFSGGGCATLRAARVGLDVAPMGVAASGGLVDAGPALGLPALPASRIVLLARSGSPAAAAATRALAAAVRAYLGGREAGPRRVTPAMHARTSGEPFHARNNHARQSAP